MALLEGIRNFIFGDPNYDPKEERRQGVYQENLAKRRAITQAEYRAQYDQQGVPKDALNPKNFDPSYEYYKEFGNTYGNTANQLREMENQGRNYATQQRDNYFGTGVLGSMLNPMFRTLGNVGSAAASGIGTALTHGDNTNEFADWWRNASDNTYGEGQRNLGAAISTAANLATIPVQPFSAAFGTGAGAALPSIKSLVSQPGFLGKVGLESGLNMIGGAGSNLYYGQDPGKDLALDAVMGILPDALSYGTKRAFNNLKLGNSYGANAGKIPKNLDPSRLLGTWNSTPVPYDSRLFKLGQTLANKGQGINLGAPGSRLLLDAAQMGLTGGAVFGLPMNMYGALSPQDERYWDITKGGYR